MAKRFTDTDIWDQDWFVDLPPKYKLFWYYVKDKCDHVGIWRPNKVIAQRIIGEPINTEEFLQFVNCEGKHRIIVLPSKRWFLKDYFVFQYGDHFSPTSPIHKGAIKSLVANGVHPSEILNGSIGKLQELSIEQIKKIAYAKDNYSLKEGFEKGINRDKEKE